MTVVWFPRVDEIKGDDTIRKAWKELKEKLKKRTKIRFEGFEDPIEWTVVIQQHDDYRKAIVMEKIVFTSQHMDYVRRKIPEAIHDPEIRITYWLYDSTKDEWVPKEDVELGRIKGWAPPLIPTCDFERLCRIYDYLKLYNSIPEQEKLEPIDH